MFCKLNIQYLMKNILIYLEIFQAINIYAGVKYTKSGDVIPTGVGRLCNWTPNPDGPPADEYSSFGAYQRSLSLNCDNGEPGVITWTPDARTPDTVYYQCFTHRYLGWKINVLDSCDELPAESAKVEVFSKPDEDLLESVPSQHVETRIKPAFNFVSEGNKTPVSFKGAVNPPVKEVVEIIEHDVHKQPINYFMTKPLYDKNLELKKTIQEGIKAAEELEQTIKFGENTGPVLFGAPSPTSSKTEPIIEYHPIDINTELKNFQKQNIPQSVFLRQPQHKPNHSQKYSIPQRRPANHHIPRRPVTYTQVMSKRPQSRPQFIMGQHSIIHNQFKKPGFKQPFRQTTKPYYAPNFNQYRHIYPPVNIRPLKSNYADMIDTSAAHEVLPGKSGPIVLGKPIPVSAQPISTDQKLLHPYPMIHYPAIAPRPQIVIDNAKINQRLDSKAYDKQTTINTHLLINKPAMTSPKPVYHHTQHMIDFDDTAPKIVLPTVRPAVNTGFKPDSVIIEGGFKPIVREQDAAQSTEGVSDLTINRRSDTVNEKEDLEAEEENVGEIFVGKRTEPFEPMFIPSPPDRQSKNKNKIKTKINMRADAIISGDKVVEMGEDKLAMAQENINSYYLPYNHAKLVGLQGDIELPVGTVITYDGKSASDSDRKSNHRYIPSVDVSDSEQVIHGKPQYAALKDDIKATPENQDSQKITDQDDENKPSQISTHLKLVSQFEESDDTPNDEASVKVEPASEKNINRQKREAHHTPEHTEMQRKEGMLNGTSMHDHSGHDHSGHDHSDHDHHHHTSNSCTILPTLSVIILVTAMSRYL